MCEIRWMPGERKRFHHVINGHDNFLLYDCSLCVCLHAFSVFPKIVLVNCGKEFSNGQQTQEKNHRLDQLLVAMLNFLERSEGFFFFENTQTKFKSLSFLAHLLRHWGNRIRYDWKLPTAKTTEQYWALESCSFPFARFNAAKKKIRFGWSISFLLKRANYKLV